MNKTAVALITLLLITATAETFLVRFGKGNPIMLKPVYAEISIQHPREEINHSGVMALNFTIRTNSYSYVLLTYNYILDGKVIGTIKNLNVTGTKNIGNDVADWAEDWFEDTRTTPSNYYYYPYVEYTLEGSAMLTGLSDGWHNVTIYQGNIDDFRYDNTISFIVDTDAENGANSSVPAAFPAVIVLTVTLAIVILAGAGFLLYRKRGRGKTQ